MTNDPKDKARELQLAIYRAAKQSATRRFHALYDKISRMEILRKAWGLVKANRGSAGVDDVTLQSIEEYGVEAFLHQLQESLEEGAFRPLPVRRHYIKKSDGRPRPLGIPVVRDRVVQAAMKIVLEPIFEADFQPCSFGFRPKRKAHDALEIIRQKANWRHDWVIDADIENYFGTIDQAKLMEMVQKRVSDRRMLKLIRKFLEAGVFEDGKVRTETAGTPQGGVISPLLANVYLNYLDTVWKKRCEEIGVLVRYADDLVILCLHKTNAMEALRRLNLVMERLGLKLHPTKTRVVNLQRGREGFDFLGFHHRKRPLWKHRQFFHLHRWPRKKAMQAIRDKVKALVGLPAHLPSKLEDLIAKLNPVLRGWGNYFAKGNSSKYFRDINRYVEERLYLYLSKKHGKSGRGWGQRWKHIDFREKGLYQLRVAARGIS